MEFLVHTRLRHWRTAFAAGLALLACATAEAQFKVTGKAPYTAPVARQKIRTLLEKADSSNTTQTVETLTGLLSWYRDILDDELIAAWKKDSRSNLPDVIKPLADARVAVAVVDFSWREQRQAAFLPAYAPMFEDSMLRFPDSAKPMLDDLVRAAAAGQPLELTEPEAETVCRILIDMPDIGAWRKTALQILPFYRETALLLLAVDVRGFPGETRDRAEFWLYDPRSPLREVPSTPAAPSSTFSTRRKASTPAPASSAAAPSAPVPVPPAPAARVAPPMPAPYNGPKSGTLHCFGQPIQPNAEYTFPGLPAVELRIELDTNKWDARVEPGADHTQTLILKNKGRRAQKSCVVNWSVE